MSYILEALKKAQAERQLGNAPTIHAPAPGYAAPAARAGRHPLLLGAAAGVLVVVLVAALGAAWLWRRPAPQVASAPPLVAAPAPAVPAQLAGEPATPAPAVQAGPASPPAAPAAKAEPASRSAPAATGMKMEPEPRAEPKEASPVRVAATPAAPAAGDDVGTLQSLPEALQREIPKVSVGGYIYSPNPAERLLLVDNMLRREGEEVAPGLVLERLLPKAAIMNYRGVRYRVGY